MKEYMPGQGSYKVEEAGGLTGIDQSYDVDNHFGTLVLNRDDVKIKARGLDLALSSIFNSDHMYSSIIPKVSKSDGPASTIRPIPNSMMTLPADQANFYRIANGWSWDLPFVLLGVPNAFKYCPGKGKVFDFLAVLTMEAWGTGTGNHCWTEGYEVTYAPEVSGYSLVTIVIPEIQATIVVNVYRSGSTPWDFTPQNDSHFVIYLSDGKVCKFNSHGFLASITDPAGKNTITYSYVSDAIIGTVASSNSRKQFCLASVSDYNSVKVGDLIAINDEIKVVFSKDGTVNGNPNTISTSCNFDVAIPPAGGVQYTIFKGQLQEITHTDGRAVKFYYYTSGANNMMTILLSSSVVMDNFVSGDQFLGLYTINSSNQLTQYQTCSDWSVKQHATKTGGFTTDLAANQSTYFVPMQTLSYTYNLTSTPNPSTDTIVVTNNVGAPTVYYFQAGGFCSHSWNNAFFHRGVCRRGSTQGGSGSNGVMNIERPDFYINPNSIAPGSYININRINAQAFEDASKADYQKDENAYDFDEANNFNTANTVLGAASSFLGIAGDFLAKGPLEAPNIILGLLGAAGSGGQYAAQEAKYARDRDIAAHAGNVSVWAPVAGVTSPNRILVGGSSGPWLTQAPRQNDTYAVVNFTPDGTSQINKTSRDSTRVYFGIQPHGSAGVFAVNDYVLLRTEIHQINLTGTETFGSTIYYFIEVDSPFQFVPDENEQAAFIYQTTLQNNGALPAKYYCYYLNKPKVVRIDFMPSPVQGSTYWKRIDYEYSYQANGVAVIDNFDAGGFSVDDVEGPDTQSFDASDISLQSTSVTVSMVNAKDEQELYSDTYTFAYDQKNFLKGQDSITRTRFDPVSQSWLFVNKTLNALSRPCSNAGYYGIVSSQYFEGGNVTINGGGAGYRKRADYIFDYYGRVVNERVISPSFEGKSSKNTWTQYVGGSSYINDLDPLGMFALNYESGNYQSLCNQFHALGVVGAIIEEVDAQGNTKTTIKGFDPATLNLLMVDVLVSSSLTTYNDILSADSPNFRAVSGSTIITDPSQIQWSTDLVHWSSVWAGSAFTGTILHAFTRFTYDPTTNNLLTITKPLGNMITLTYGSGWLSSYISKDYKTLDNNLGGSTQYVVALYNYDIKGRLISKTVVLSSDVNGATPYVYGNNATATETQYTYDGMDRMLLKSVGNGTTQVPVLQTQYLDTGDSSWPNLPYTIVTDYLGFRTKTYYDALYRVVSVEKYKPNQPTGGNLSYSSSWEVKISDNWTVWQAGIDKVAQTTTYTNIDEATAHSIITKNTYDNIGRLLQVQNKNNDVNYQGDSRYHLIKNIVYDDTKNAITTQLFIDDGASDYLQTEVDNDWLGRGPIKEITWTGTSGTGIVRTTTNHYRHDGKLIKKDLPNGEESFQYFYDNCGKLEQILYPDGTFVSMINDLNGNLVQIIDRRSLSTTMAYNQSDLEVTRTSIDAVRGNTVITTTYTQFGPAAVVKTENAAAIVQNDFQYDLSGKPNYRDQVIDGYTMKIVYTYDAAGNLLTVTPTGSGSSPWTNTFNIIPQFHPANPDNDNFNREAVADNSTGKNIITLEPDLLGLTTDLKYGDYAALKGEMSYGYDKFLRPLTLHSNESTRALDITLTRDFIGNILSRVEPVYGSIPAVNNQYVYDGMNRLSSGEGATEFYDELSNLVALGANSYIYQDPSESDLNDQMRLASFNNGTVYEYTYDSNGNPITISNRFTSLSYDNLNALRQIVYGQTDNYWYDNTGLRVKKTENAAGAWKTTYTMFEGDNPIMQEVYTASGRIQTVFNIIVKGKILAQYKMVYPSTLSMVYFYLDNLDSRRVVLSTTPAIIDRYHYSAWGILTQDIGSDIYGSFTGKDYDASGLIYFNARYYDPTTGRFLTEDPSCKGVNWYAYCENDPINKTDPTGRDVGLQTRKPTQAATQGAGMTQLQKGVSSLKGNAFTDVALPTLEAIGKAMQKPAAAALSEVTLVGKFVEKVSGTADLLSSVAEMATVSSPKEAVIKAVSLGVGLIAGSAVSAEQPELAPLVASSVQKGTEGVINNTIEFGQRVASAAAGFMEYNYSPVSQKQGF